MVLTNPDERQFVVCSISKRHWVWLPFNINQVIRCGCKSFIFNYFLFTFKNNSIMVYPGFAIPQFVIESNLLNWD